MRLESHEGNQDGAGWGAADAGMGNLFPLKSVQFACLQTSEKPFPISSLLLLLLYLEVKVQPV